VLVVEPEVEPEHMANSMVSVIPARIIKKRKEKKGF
jgi:hypothetical protein